MVGGRRGERLGLVTIPARTAAVLAVVVALAGCLVLADALLIEPNRMTVSVLDLPQGRLASALGSDRFVFLSDLHLRGWGVRESRLRESIRTARPDLIVMTGDYADTEEGVAVLGRLFEGIAPRLGIVAVPGNNDYFRGRQDRIFEALRGAGAKILRNESIVLSGSGGEFAVAGVDDPFFGRDDVGAALAGFPEGMPALLLAHSPSVLADRSEAMLFNAGDADGPWGVGSFWQDGSHFRPPIPPISFAAAGRHRLRVQRREDGTGIEALRLVPAEAPGAAHQGDGPDRTPPSTAEAPGVIDIDLCPARPRGSWRAERGANGSCVLFDTPDSNDLASFAVASPEDVVDLGFDAPAGVPYRLWARIVSPTSNGRSDSFYAQIDDAIDAAGQPRYRIESALPKASGERVDLLLAGHTHGGQVRLPGLGPVERTLTKGRFVMGRYEEEGTLVYISRGVGMSYLPLRLDCPPEMVVIEAAGARQGVNGI